MFILRPSSPFKTAQLQKSEAPEAAVEALQPTPEAATIADLEAPTASEPFIDLGLPIPDSYQTDILRALVQDPFRVFVYWEVRDANLKALTNYFAPPEVESFTTVLKLRDLRGGQEAYFPVGSEGRYWMMVFPDRRYEFEIGVRSPLHGYISLLRSNVVQTPRGTVSPVTADEADYRLEPVEFLDVLEKSGFGAEQSLDITVAAMPGVGVGEEFIEATLQKLPDTVRGAIDAALAGDRLTGEMIDGLPESIRQPMQSLWQQGGGEVAAVGLMHYLPELLKETLADERDWVTDQTHPLHLSPRFFIGASEMAQAPFGEINLPKPARRHPSSDEKYQQPANRSGVSLRRWLANQESS